MHVRQREFLQVSVMTRISSDKIVVEISLFLVVDLEVVVAVVAEVDIVVMEYSKFEKNVTSHELHGASVVRSKLSPILVPIQ
jgi:hypothetical protein